MIHGEPQIEMIQSALAELDPTFVLMLVEDDEVRGMVFNLVQAIEHLSPEDRQSVATGIRQMVKSKQVFS
jgi:hypothetical protein